MKYDIIIETSDGQEPFNNGNAVGLLADLAEVERAIDFIEVEFKKKPDTTFMYKITHADARIWDQDITIPPGGDASMKFNVNTWWTETEFAAQRNLRSHLIHLAQDHELTKFKVTKTA